MTTHVTIYFKCKGRMCSVILKTSAEEITLTAIKARMYEKLALDESKVKLKLSYIPQVVGCEEKLTISDDEDLFAYLTSMDKENRRSLLVVEVISRPEQFEQVSRVDKSSFGTNYEELHPNAVEVGPNAVTLYVESGQADQQNELIQADDEDDTRRGDCVENVVDTGMDRFIMCDEDVEHPPYEQQCQFVEAWEDGLGLSLRQEFASRKEISELVDRAAFVKCFGYDIKKSDLTRWVVKCSQPNCNWGIRAARIPQTEIFSIRTYTNMHTCSRASQSSSNDKRRGEAGLVASLLNEEYPGQMETPTPKIIMDLVKRKFGVDISYSTALRGKNQAVCDLRGSPEESYKMLYCYCYMLEVTNPGTVTKVELDEHGKFKYLFIALGACIEGFRAMRKVIVVDATFLKNGYGGVLVFATAQDPNRHHYLIAFGVIDGENNPSWFWFFERLKSIVPDFSELVFMSDRNASLINAIGNVFPQATHGHCVWNLSQNVKGHASNVNKDVVTWRLMELSRHYTVADFETAYESFKTRYQSAAKYVEESTVKEKWARSYFQGDRYNLDTINSVESMNSVFREARKYSLVPMLDAIVKKISDWFNEHRKDAVSGSIDNKLVPLVENYLHDIWAEAEKLLVREVNSYELEYEITGSDGKLYLVSLVSRSCSCRMFDIEKYPCVHALAGYIYFKRHHDAGHGRGRDIQLELHELCTKYYWTELWALAYSKTIYVVPDRSEWNVPDYIKTLQIIPPVRVKKTGRKIVKRKPSVGERRRRTLNNWRRKANL